MDDQLLSGPPPTRWPQLAEPDRLDRILDIIAEEGALERSKLTPEATLESLGLASMDVVMILMGVEEKLETYLPMTPELAAARNMAEFVTFIEQAAKSPSAGVAAP